MEATTRNLQRIFDPTIQYQVPLFQRPYVWSRDENLEPLWDDILSLLNRVLRFGKTHPHFLGAVVFEQLTTATGSIETRQVIDGQQRLTTLQLFLIAARDKAAERGMSKYHERFADMVGNRKSRIDHDSEECKLWPTNSDRLAFRIVFEAASPAALEVSLRDAPDARHSKIVAAYFYFCTQLENWLSDDSYGDEDVARSLESRFDALWQVSRNSLQLVVIDLDDQDETQVIFETLNARGEELLPADLIKNLLFRRAVAEGADAEHLYEKYWRGFETPFWREVVSQGRIYRPRIDVFINHYLTLMTLDEVKSTHLFNAFKSYISEAQVEGDTRPPSPQPTSGHIAQLARYARVFVQLTDPTDHEELKDFIHCLDAVGTSTAIPFLLRAHADLMPGDVQSLNSVLKVVESFLIRRMVCGLTPKNYNRLFVDLLRACDRAGGISLRSVEDFLGRATGDSVRFPEDRELMSALTSQPMYGRLSQLKIRYVLERLDGASYHRKSERQALPAGLSIEHVMPQTWEMHWPLPLSADPIEQQMRSDRRNLLLNTLGNLTLVTGSLNPALSNAAWTVKRPELLKYSKLNLNQFFHEPDADDWNEEAIEQRTRKLTSLMIALWPALNASSMVIVAAGTAQASGISPPSSARQWDDRDRALERKLRSLYETHRGPWIAALNGRMFEEKWHVGRALLQWFLERDLLTRAEFDSLNEKYSRPGKPGYDVEMYRIVWKESGRASDEVAAICLAPRRGPPKSDKSAPNIEGWRTQGVLFPTGTQFRCFHKGEPYMALVTADSLFLNGKNYRSVSAAAEAITGTAVNGWRFWHCQMPGSTDWRLISDLRAE